MASGNHVVGPSSLLLLHGDFVTVCSQRTAKYTEYMNGRAATVCQTTEVFAWVLVEGVARGRGLAPSSLFTSAHATGFCPVSPRITEGRPTAASGA